MYAHSMSDKAINLCTTLWLSAVLMYQVSCMRLTISHAVLQVYHSISLIREGYL